MNLRRIAAAAVTAIAVATAAATLLASPPREGFAADPPAHASEKQWVFEVTYDKGAKSITSARSANAKQPIATARAIGRFALELWVGKELLDRIRFDVPLLGADVRARDPKDPLKRPTFDRVTTKLKVQMADHPRATVLAFVDRSTGETVRYFWPPDEKGQLTLFSAKAATTGTASAAPANTAAASATPSSTAAASTPAASASASATAPPASATASATAAPSVAKPPAR